MIAAVNELLAKCKTYEQIARFLTDQGHEIGKSSVGRYAQDIAEVARELNLVTEQLKPILSQVAENPNLELGSVATQMGLMQVIKFLKAEKFDSEDSASTALASLCHAAAGLQRSQAVVEKYRLEYREKKAQADKAMEKLGTEKGSSKETIEKIKTIYGI
jgi:hypothetical protein